MGAAARRGELAALGLLDSGTRRADPVGIVIIGMVGMTEKSRDGGCRIASEADGEERDNAAIHEGWVVVPHYHTVFAQGSGVDVPRCVDGALMDTVHPRAEKVAVVLLLKLPGEMAGANLPDQHATWMQDTSEWTMQVAVGRKIFDVIKT